MDLADADARRVHGVRTVVYYKVRFTDAGGATGAGETMAALARHIAEGYVALCTPHKDGVKR
jgi:hypothetical protein